MTLRDLCFTACAVVPAALASGQDLPVEKFIELEWQTTANGSLGILPNPAAGGATDKPYVLFGPLVGGHRPVTLWHDMRNQLRNPHTWLVLLAPGPRDGASTTLADIQLGALGHAGDDDLLALLSRRAVDEPERHTTPDALDRLMAMRAASERGLRVAREPIEWWASDESVEPFFRRAARESAADLGGQPFTAPEPELTDLRDCLGQLPSDAALVLRVDTTRSPEATRIGAALRRLAARRIRVQLAAAGGAPSPAALAGAQSIVDWPGLLGYEMARRFGNWRVFRTVAALGDDGKGGVAFDVGLDGEFGLGPLGAGLALERLVPNVEAGRLSVDGPDGVRLEAWPNRLRIRRLRDGVGGPRLVDELLAAGVDGGDAVWIHRRPGVEWPGESNTARQLAWMDRFATFTLRASFDAALEVDFKARLRDPAHAAAVREELDAVRAWADAAGMGKDLSAELRDGEVIVSWLIADRPAVDAIVRAIDAVPVPE